MHISNVIRLKMTWQEAFDPCTNLRTGSEIFRGFYTQAVQAGYRSDSAAFAALRGFNSGSVHNPVSNGYAKAILSRVGIVPAVLPPSVVSALSPTVATASAQAKPAQDDGSPDMFATPSTSLFGERRDALAQTESANVTVADAEQAGAHPSIETSAAPVVLRASIVP
ncbi:hypothetical protein WT12_08430 [Burkholderia territorii]|nr:hypothetical protein WT12_08430 [Burkholderia territorii]